MISIVGFILMSLSLGIQPGEVIQKHHLVEILPAKTYVICSENCDRPTPKTKKTIVSREGGEIGFTTAPRRDMYRNAMQEVLQSMKALQHQKNTAQSIPASGSVPTTEKHEVGIPAQ